jgi:hypothetical protein
LPSRSKAKRVTIAKLFRTFYTLLPTPGNRSIKRKERKLRVMGLPLFKQRRNFIPASVNKSEVSLCFLQAVTDSWQLQHKAAGAAAARDD